MLERRHLKPLCLKLIVNAGLSCALMVTSLAIADDIKIGGAGPAMGTMRLLAERYNQTHDAPKISVLAASLGSAGGIRAATEGAIDIGVSSVPLTESERDKGAREIEVARTPFVFVVGMSTPVSGLSTRQLQSIYWDTYEKKDPDWSGYLDRTLLQTDASAVRIRIIMRPANESDNAIIKKISPEIDTAMTALEERPGMIVKSNAQENAVAIEEIPGAFGTSTLSLIVTEHRKMRPLKLDGVDPSPQTVANGRYPYYKSVFLITGTKSSPGAQDFIAFVKSKDGREILEKTGHAVVDKPKQ
ncbi:substrate-binding domain-containing protein [Paraburkholderia rhizosphaerae]|uniref:Phosphate ABC transporter substrate-binding protein (PhoT family) n=1 Tax=Paraburkholderia rhizosphaerae TaxID=480658 RepID=A0A4V3HDD0_9BURK|nr:substrate-binding domain-containing protein [Paraburkholderia rhizosphaerae]TDY40554.1 phosphate ABC transporter substrate-binding protein (PhoT family) [Paraburkholderia rhizosphaerae]